MSSPIGHSLAGWVIASSRNRALLPFDRESLKRVLLYMFIANAPDLDFFPGMITGKPNLYHHGISHSLGAALFSGLLVALFLSRKKKAAFWRECLFIILIFCSHLMLDLLSVDGRPPCGIPLFWPVSEQFFMFPLLPPVQHSALDHASLGQFFADIFSLHNLYVIGMEILLTIPFACMLHRKLQKDQGTATKRNA